MGKELVALRSAIKSVRSACQINAGVKFNSKLFRCGSCHNELH
jgi:hypothetical protein